MKLKIILAKVWKSFKGLFQMSRYQGAIPSLISIGFGIVFGILTMFIIWILALTKVFNTTNMPEFFYGVAVLLAGGFNEGMDSIGDMLYAAAPLILAGLSVGFAFKTGLFNIGAPGQIVVGGLTAITIGLKITLPAPWHWMLALIAGVIAAGLWGLIIGALKALLNVHEVVASIMMNYISIYTAFLIIKGNNMVNTQTSQTLQLPASALLPHGEVALFAYYDMNIGIIIAILAVIILYIVLNKTTLGYQLKAVGFNKDASKYAGMNTKRNIMISMTISGMLAGLAGAILIMVSGKYFQLTKEAMMAEVMSVGFDGISVALLGLSQPVGALFAGLFLSYIRQGGYYLNLANYMAEMADVITAVIIYFSALSTALYALVKNRKIKFEALKKIRISKRKQEIKERGEI
jgi:simple sugar transport system permease protein